MADRRIDRSFLGEAVIRLSRALGISGEVSPSFDAGDRIQPVVLVADATTPGYRGQSLRGFAYGETVGAVAGNHSKMFIKARPGTGGVIIDGFTISCGTVPVAAVEWRIGILGSNEPDPAVIGQTNVRFTERCFDSNGDHAPVLVLPDATDALAYGLNIAYGTLPANTTIVLPIPVVLAPNGKLIMQGIKPVAQTMNFGFWGRAL